MRATARIVQSDQAPAASWRDRAARHSRQVRVYLWQQLPVSACPLDELWSFVQTKAQHRFAAKRGCARDGDAGVSLACAPIGRRVVALVLGKPTQARATRLRARVAHVTSERIPLFTADQLADDRTAVRQGDGQW